MAETPFSALQDLSGIHSPSFASSTTKKNKVLSSVNKYTADELKEVIQSVYVPQRDNQVGNYKNNSVSTTDVINALYPHHIESVSKVQDKVRLRTLAPEIGQAEIIITSSIMSPNDLQENEPSITLDGVPELSEEVTNEIIQYLEDFFSKQYTLGNRMINWCKEAKFKSGAAVEVLLPCSSIETIAKNVQKNKLEDHKLKGQEYLPSAEVKEFTPTIDETLYDALLDKPLFSGDKNVAVEKFSNYKDTSVAIENYFGKNYTDSIVQMLKYNDFLDTSIIDTKEKTKYMDRVVKGIEAVTATITTKLEDGDAIKITENPEVLRFGRAVRHYAKTRMGKNLMDLYNPYPYGVSRGNLANPDDQETILDFGTYLNNEKIYDSERPFSLTLPTESVIPITMPGTKEEKLGYFLLIDSTGKPINANTYVSNASGNTVSGRINNSFNSMFGGEVTAGATPTPMHGSYRDSNMSGIYPDKNMEVTGKIFNQILDITLHRKLAGMGLQEITFGEYEDIATCMFYRALEHKKTTLVFLPESIVTYVAFDYRENGTGKSVLDDIDFLLSLRATQFVADMFAMMKNSIPRKEITVNFDANEVNPHQKIDMIKNAVIDKNRLQISHDPTIISQNMANMNLSIKSTHPSNSGFSVEHQDTQHNVPKTDSDLQEHTDRLITMALGVPKGALDTMSEQEFAIAIATVNLLFSNMIALDQKILCKFTTEHVKRYIRFSKELRDGITELLKGSIVNDLENSDNIQIPEGDGNITDKKEKKEVRQSNLVNKIINNLNITLPKPNIAPAKAQFEALTNYTQVIKDTIDMMYPEELLHSDTDSGLNDALKMVKAQMVKNFTTDFINAHGLNSVLQIDELSKFFIENREKMVGLRRILDNLTTDIKKDAAGMSDQNVEDSDDGGSSW